MARMTKNPIKNNEIATVDMAAMLITPFLLKLTNASLT
jgi:hypothetical protein